MDALDIIRSEIAAAHTVMDQVLDGLTDEQLHRRINPDTTNAIAAVYAHVVMGEDLLIQQRIMGKPPLLEGWQERLAVPQDREALWSWHFPDFALLRQYAGEVYAATESTLAALTAADMDREVEGFRGPMAIGEMLTRIVTSHSLQHAGEMSALKGAMGMKGGAF